MSKTGGALLACYLGDPLRYGGKHPPLLLPWDHRVAREQAIFIRPYHNKKNNAIVVYWLGDPLPNTGWLLRWRSKAKMVFHPGRKTRTAPGVFRLRKYSSKELTISNGISFSGICLMVC